MLRALLATAAATAVSLAIAASALGHGTSAVTLKGTVGPGYTITLTKAGKKVKTLKRGSYKFVISDRATIHSFSLDGPHGFAHDFTSVPFKGTKTATLKLKAGTYKYYCEAHESLMFGHFKVK
jgi:plastocyanin